MYIFKFVTDTPTIEVTPQTALVDQPVCIRLSGLPPRTPVTLRAYMRGLSGNRWESYATYIVDDEGMVDVTTQQPRSGTYDQADPMGLFWSMTIRPSETTPAGSVRGNLAPTEIRLMAEVAGCPVSETVLTRLRVGPGVRRVPVRERGLVGVLFLPAGPGPHPVIISVGGSGGGMHEWDAALLASHGYAALALAYFGMEGIPLSLVNIPLEYFETAIDWLHRQEGVRVDRLGIIGGSRGGELALLLGATLPAITAVVSYFGSGVGLQGIGRHGLVRDVQDRQPAWTYRGQPFPFMPVYITPTIQAQLRAGEPVALRSAFQASLEDGAAVEAATIPVERINGAVLLVSGDDDQVWPSTILSDLAMARLARHNHPYPFDHLRYERAGHGITATPYGPTTLLEVPGPGYTLALGGNARDNAFARTDAWLRTLAFLRQHLAES